MKEKEQSDSKVNEPAAEFGSRKLTVKVFNSFEEMNEDRIRDLASLTHEQGLAIIKPK